MNLHEHLETALLDRAPVLDAERLIVVARRRGASARRRRRAASAVALVAVAGLAAWSVDRLRGSEAGPGIVADPTTGSTPVITFDPAHPGTSGAATARAAVAGLLWSIEQVSNGAASGLQGQSATRLSDGDYEASLTWTTVDGSADVVVNVQYDVPGGDCTAKELCTSTTRPDGSRLRVYALPSFSNGGDTHAPLDVELIRPDGTRVVARVEETSGRATPVLSQVDVSRIVTQPFWSRRLPATFARQGNRLAPFDDATRSGETVMPRGSH